MKIYAEIYIIVDEGSWGDPRGSPMGFIVGVNGNNGKYPFFLENHELGKALMKLLEK